MAFPYIVLEFKNGITDGDTVSMDANGQSPFIFEAVSNLTGTTPGYFSFNGLAEDDANSFSDSAFISLSQQYYSVVRNGTTVTISSLLQDAAYNFGTVSSSTSSIVLIKQVNEDGSIPVDISVGATQVDITSFTHTLKGWSVPQYSNDFLLGNIGDKIETKINFTTSVAVNYFEFQYGLVNNSLQIYSGNNYSISNELFNSQQTLQSQSYSGEAPTLQPRLPYTWFAGPYESVTLTNLGGNNWELTHTYLITPFLKPENITGTGFNYPTQFEGNNSIKYIFKIVGKASLLDTVPLVSTDNVDLSAYFGNGNVGFLNELYNSGQVFFKLNNFSFDTTENTINTFKDSVGSGTIETLVANFATTNDVVCFIQKISNENDVNKTLVENYDIDRIELKADGVPVNGNYLTNVSAVASGSVINFSLTVPAGTIEGDYAIWFAVTFSDVSPNHHNVLCQIGTTFVEADDSAIVMTTYPDAPRAEFNFNYHYNNDIANSFNQVKSFIEDRLVARWRIENQDLTLNELVSFTIQIKNTVGASNVFEERTFTPFSIPLETNRDFKLQTNDLKNEVSIEEVSPGVWDFVYGFQIWDSMKQPIGVTTNGYRYGFTPIPSTVFSCTCVFTQTRGDEKAEVTKEFRSPYFEFGDYGKTKNSSPDAVVLPAPQFLEFWQESTFPAFPVDGILKGTNTRVRATFEAQAGDLQRNEDELVGYLGINAKGFNQNTYEQFSSIVSNGVARPWEQITGEVNFNALVTKVNASTVQIEAVVVWDKLKDLFENVEEFCVSARIDSIQSDELFFILRTNRNPGVDGNFTGTVDSTFDIDYVFANGSIVNATSPDNLINTSGNGLDGTDQNIKLIIDDLSSITSLEFADSNIIENVNISSLIGIEDIRLQSNAIDSLELPDGASINNFLLFENSGTLTSIDLSNIDLSGIVNVSADSLQPFTKLTSLTLPNNSNVFSQIWGSDNNLSSLDLSGLTNLGGSIQFSRNPNLISLNLPNSSQVFTSLIFVDCDITGQVDASGLTSLGGNIRFNNNTSLTDFVFPTSTENITTMFFNDCDLTGNVDLSGMTGLGGIVQFQRNSNLTSLTLPTSNNTITTFGAQQCDIIGTLDLSSLNGLSVNIRLEENPNMTNVLFPTNSLPINNLYINDCNLSSVLDLSVLSGLGGIIQLQRNSLTGINWPTSTNPTTNVGFSQNNITGSVDMTGMVLGGSFRAGDNANLTQILHGPSTQNLFFYNAVNCNITGTHDLTNLTNLSGSIILQNNPLLNNLSLPIINGVISTIDLSLCSIGVVDWAKFTATNNNINISLNDNNMSQADVDSNLAALVTTGWTGGFLNIAGNNSAPSASGLSSVTTLNGLGWTVTVTP